MTARCSNACQLSGSISRTLTELIAAMLLPRHSSLLATVALYSEALHACSQRNVIERCVAGVRTQELEEQGACARRHER